MLPVTLPPSPVSNVAQLALPARPDVHETILHLQGDPVFAAAIESWRLHLALAWSYPRLWYAVWSQLTAVPSQRGTDR